MDDNKEEQIKVLLRKAAFDALTHAEKEFLHKLFEERWKAKQGINQG